jgi:hypothetical protein
MGPQLVDRFRLVIQRQSSQKTYQSKHALICGDAAWQMLRDTRRTLHRRIADAPRQIRPGVAERRSPCSPIIAPRPVFPEKALDHWIRPARTPEEVRDGRGRLVPARGSPLALVFRKQMAEPARAGTPGCPRRRPDRPGAMLPPKPSDPSRAPAISASGSSIAPIPCRSCTASGFRRSSNELVSARRQAALELAERTNDDYWRWTVTGCSVPQASPWAIHRRPEFQHSLCCTNRCSALLVMRRPKMTRMPLWLMALDEEPRLRACLRFVDPALSGRRPGTPPSHGRCVTPTITAGLHAGDRPDLRRLRADAELATRGTSRTSET